MLKAVDVMTRHVLTVDVASSVTEVGEFLVSNGISGAPVADGARIVGFVSLTDLARHGVGSQRASVGPRELLEGFRSAEIDAEEARSFSIVSSSTVTARDIMTPTLFSVEEDTPVDEIADMMFRGRIHRVVVTRKGHPVGIVSAMDLLGVAWNRAPLLHPRKRSLADGAALAGGAPVPREAK